MGRGAVHADREVSPHCIRQGDAGRYQLPGTGRYEIYDYKTDPDGNVNIAADPKNKDLLAKLIAMMDVGWKAARPDV